MSSSPVSAIVVNYNGEGFLELCLNSLKRLEEAGGDVLLVDNASTDASVDLVRRRFPAVRILALERNLGFGRANNLGAKEARGDFLLLLNSDAWLVDDSWTRLRGRLEGNPRLGIATPRLFYPDGRPQFSWVPEMSVVGESVQKIRSRFEGQSWNHGRLVTALKAILGQGWASGACMFLRKKAFEEVGGFDPDIFLYFEDVDLCVRLRKAGWKLAYVSQARVFHRAEASWQGRSRELEYRRGQLYYYRTQRPAWEGRLLRWHLIRKYRRIQEPSETQKQIVALLEAW